MVEVTKPTLGRLPLYLDYLRLLPRDVKYISSTTIARALKLGGVQVRKDLNALCGTGKPKIGYLRTELIKSLEGYTKQNRDSVAIIVGAGKLGKAFLDYKGFEKYGLTISAAFEKDETLIGKKENGKEIINIDDLPKYCKNNVVSVGIIAVPHFAAQEVCDTLVDNGVKAIWNFAPVKLEVPDNVIVQQEDMALSLAYLNYSLQLLK